MVDRDKSSAKHLRAQQAKEFLISQIIEQARRENVSLSEVEQKMLYFTEAEETLPDIYEVNEQFERETAPYTRRKSLACSAKLINATNKNRLPVKITGNRRSPTCAKKTTIYSLWWTSPFSLPATFGRI